MPKLTGRRNAAMYCVIVGDIVNSRELAPDIREKVTRAAKDIFDRINTDHIGSLMTTFGMVRGDSFEGVMLTQHYAPQIVQDIIKAFYRVEKTTVRISVVLGQLTVTGSDRNDTDGPAFHKALDDLAKIKERKSTHWLQVSFDIGPLAQGLIDSQLALLTALTKGWTDKQREIVWAMDAHGEQQKTVGKLLNIPPSVVSKQLKAANYEAYRLAWSGLTDYLVNIDEYAAEDRPVIEKSYVPVFNIALRKMQQRQFEEALALLHRSLDLAKRDLPENDPLLAPIYNALAEAYTNTRKYHEAETAIQESMRLQKNMPRARLQYAETVLEKGKIDHQRGSFAAAQKNYKKALGIARDILDANHPFFECIYTALSLLPLAVQEMGRR